MVKDVLDIDRRETVIGDVLNVSIRVVGQIPNRTRSRHSPDLSPTQSAPSQMIAPTTGDRILNRLAKRPIKALRRGFHRLTRRP
jgi:hypothetical protein